MAHWRIFPHKDQFRKIGSKIHQKKDEKRIKKLLKELSGGAGTQETQRLAFDEICMIAKDKPELKRELLRMSGGSTPWSDISFDQVNGVFVAPKLEHATRPSPQYPLTAADFHFSQDYPHEIPRGLVTWVHHSSS